MSLFYEFNIFKHYPKVLHVVTKKSAQFPYHFSVALHTHQQPYQILQNRSMIEEYFERYSPLHYVLAKQTHSHNIKTVDTPKTQGWKEFKSAIDDCDALITDKRQIMLGVLTADCVPILMYDSKNHIISAVHAGWKGTKDKIVLKTLLQMKQKYHTNPADVLVGIAPAIGECCYEVGEEVAQHFFDMPKSFKKKTNGKYMLNLAYINQQQLLNVGVEGQNIEQSNICTACHTEEYFSYRKEKGCNGRFMSIIGLK